ncbi:MAG: AMP-binding protein [Bryobacterales bacterium]|nr:AMP-binding protein [Bryobacterales bacterium]
MANATQLEKLRRLISRIYGFNPFYTPRLSQAGIDERVESIDAFRNAMPFTTKQDLIADQKLHPPFGSNLTFPPERYTRFCQTSATTGKPMRWLDTPESWNWMLSNWDRVYETAGIHSDDRIFFAFSFGPFLGFWTAFDAAARLGCLCIPGGGMRSAARLRVMLDTRATVLCCTPTYAIHLAEAAGEERIDRTEMCVRAILVAGEPGGSIPGTRARIEQLWPGARVVDHHGMSEVGPVSYGCPARPGVLHIIEESYIAEVVDPQSGQPAAPGLRGELVLTGLGRAGSPLLRYRTGDLVQAAPPAECACGSRDMALEGGILGRTDDMVVVRGVNVYPGAVEDVMRSVSGVAEYQVKISVERSLVELHLDAEPDPAHAGDRDLAHRLESALRDALALRIPVRLVDPGTLPRYEMKAKRWIRV